MVAIAILAVAMLPLSAGFFADQKVLRSHYWRAVAMEIVDGEMEILVAGEHRANQVSTLPHNLAQLRVAFEERRQFRARFEPTHSRHSAPQRGDRFEVLYERVSRDGQFIDRKSVV